VIQTRANARSLAKLSACGKLESAVRAHRSERKIQLLSLQPTEEKKNKKIDEGLENEKE